MEESFIEGEESRVNIWEVRYWKIDYVEIEIIKNMMLRLVMELIGKVVDIVIKVGW